MRYVEVTPGCVALRDGPPPTLRAGWARVRVLACGICGSDIHLAKGMVLPTGSSYPVRPGHEVAGLVEAVEADGPPPGALVVLHPVDPCRRCRACRAGEEQRCPEARTLGIGAPGGMAEVVAWPADRLVVLSGISPAEAALLPDAVATAYHALAAAKVPPGGSLCVLGAGGVGTQVLQLAAVLDPSVRLVAVVRSDAAAGRAERLGALVVQGLAGAPRRVRDAVGGLDAVIDFSGAADAPAAGVRMLARGGRLVLGSITDQTLDLGTSATGIATRELRVIGTYTSSLSDLQAVAGLVSTGRLDVSDSVTHRLPLEQAVTAFDLVAGRPAGLVRLVLEPD